MQDSRLLGALACAFSYPENGIGETLAPLRKLAEEADAEARFGVDVAGGSAEAAGAAGGCEGANGYDSRDDRYGRPVNDALDALLEASRQFADPTAEKLAYTRLFIGSFKMEAPPYASYYLGEGGTLNGKAAAEVSAIYGQFGLQLDDGENAPADHLRYMLHFLALLAARHEETGDEAFAEAYRDFRDEYVTSWYGSFRALVDENAEEPYYPKLVALIERSL